MRLKALMLPVVACCALTTASFAGEGKTTDKEPAVREDADNSAINKRDRDENAPTADQQKNNKADVETTAKIRRAIMKDKSLSTYAHNVKIITQDGVVTLKGPVRSEAEKQTVEKRAAAIAGDSKVKNEIEIAPKE